jgi:hypothetical protein
LLLGALGVLAPQPVWSLCSATPQAALASYREHLPAQKAQPEEQGFRVWRTMKDAALGRRWFWVQQCGAPERPAQLLWAPLAQDEDEAAGELPAVAEDHLLVHSGDAVVVSQESDKFSMRLAGHALEAGELGKSVRVEVDAMHRVTIMVGTISGKGEVRVGG